MRESNAKRPISAISAISAIEDEDARQSKKTSTGDLAMAEAETAEAEAAETTEAAETVRVGMTETETTEAEAAEAETAEAGRFDVAAFRKFRKILIRRPCVHESAFEITKGDGEEPFYISGLHASGRKEGLAIAAHHDVPQNVSEESVAARLEEVRDVLRVLLAHVDELAESLRKFSSAKFSRDDLRAKLTYMLGATWTGLMCANSQGTGQGTLQCFPCYYMLVAS